MNYEDRVSTYLKDGQHWRAKELFQGRLSGKFDPKLCEDYGKVLLAMNDTLDAGKYLFVSGVREPEYERAIELYLNRFAKPSFSQLLNTFPKSLQREPFEAYPDRVVEDLKHRGYELKRQRAAVKDRARESSFKDRVVEKVVIGVIIAIFVSFCIGVFVGLREVWRYIFL